FAANARSAEDSATPSGQAMAALALLRLEQLTGNRALRSRAGRLINAYAAGMKRSPAAYPTLLLAAQFYFGETPAPMAADPVRVTVTGAPAPVLPGQAVTVELRLTIAAGWHVGAAQAKTGDAIPVGVA